VNAFKKAALLSPKLYLSRFLIRIPDSKAGIIRVKGLRSWILMRISLRLFFGDSYEPLLENNRPVILRKNKRSYIFNAVAVKVKIGRRNK
jgi:hypothetical protein